MHDPRQLGSSFMELVRSVDPQLLPGAATVSSAALSPQATTIVAVCHDGGVVMAGDRRATRGNEIAQRDIEKVFPADDHTLVGIAGAAGFAMDLARLFAVELSHYEKIEGAPLSFDGKANRLGVLVRANLSLAMQGLVVVPLFAGWDGRSQRGRIVEYDATGGHYEEKGFAAIGSGASFARGSLKKLFRLDFDENRAALACIQALFDAADEDSATGGPDIARGLYPVVLSAGRQGVRRWSGEQVAELSSRLIEARMLRPDGPEAPLP
ncbi:proteasome subunit beta [Propionibacterium cyclohexanicum]|nr:proteasome subunit beta [Propionibacterium cyclohexanicum]